MRITYRHCVPWTNEDPVEGLISPELPDVVEAKGGLSDTDAAPSSQEEDEKCVLELSGTLGMMYGRGRFES